MTNVRTKTAEELYDEEIAALGSQILYDFLSDGVDWLTIVEALAEEGVDEEDVQKDVYTYVHDALDTIIQRWEDRDS